MKFLKWFITIVTILILLLLAVSYTRDIPLTELKEKYTNAESKFVDINGLSVHYRIEGAGFPLILVHGTASSLHTWDDWTRLLKDDFMIIRMDLPAFGLTGPNEDRDYSIESYVEFLKDFLAHLGIDSFYLAGNSLGGEIAWHYAFQYPDEVKKLILLDAAGYVKDLPTIFKIARLPVLSTLLKNTTPKALVEKNIKEVYSDDSKVTEDLVDRYYELSLRPGNRQAFIDRASGKLYANEDLVKEIKTPTLIQWGKDDEWILLGDAYKFQKDIANSELIVYEGVGHVPMEESPEQTAKDAREFLMN